MKSDRVSFGAALPYSSWETIAELVPRIEKAGFDAVWLGDHLVGSQKPPSIEAWTALSALASTTKKVYLGTDVTDPHRRNPALLAQTMMTLDHVSGGRAILGIGAGEAMNLEPYGYTWDHPVSRMEECIELVKRLWTEESVDHSGRYYQMNGAIVSPKPLQEPYPPIWIAANAPRTLKMTGRIADGWLPITIPLKMFAQEAEIIREAAKGAGRDPSDVTLGVVFPFFIGDSKEIRERVSRIARTHGAQHSHRIVRQGADIDTSCDNMNYTYSDDNVKALMKAAESVPEELVIDGVLTGSPEECADKLEGYVDAGMRHICLNVGAGGNIEQAQELIDVIKGEFMTRFR